MQARLPQAPPIRLDRPGAGLPFWQALIARYWIVPRYAKQMSWEAVDRFFTTETNKILAAYGTLSPEQRTVPVLVPRLQGLEDSSRFWSPAMVLEHLVIVGSGMQNIIIELSHGRAPEGKADTAAVKPLGGVAEQEMQQKFQDFCGSVLKILKEKVADQEAASTFPHPWFGPLTARKWHWLLASHMRIHRKQLEEICRQTQA